MAADQLEPLNFLYEENGWLDVMPETLIPLISKDGNIYSVPVNIHRANVLWYNPAVLADIRRRPVPDHLDEWFAAMDTLQAAGMTPLALGEQWTAMHLFETILLGRLGPEKYNGLWDGTTDWSCPEVKAGLEDLRQGPHLHQHRLRLADLAGCRPARGRWRCRLQRDGRLGRRLLP